MPCLGQIQTAHNVSFDDDQNQASTQELFDGTLGQPRATEVVVMKEIIADLLSYSRFLLWFNGELLKTGLPQ
jgi:hypothetical protein